MPRQLITHDDEIRLDLRRGFIERAQGMHRLAKPLRQLGPRGVIVPPPPAGSQGAVVKLWSAKVSGTAAHVSYLAKGKGRDGADAEVFGPDLQGLLHRAKFDTHQIRAMVSLDAGDRVDLKPFIERLMVQVAQDVHAPQSLDWVAAVHHDTAHVHAHLLIRGRDLDGRALYVTKHYWVYGWRYRVQWQATQLLGRVESPGLTHAIRTWWQQRMHERSQAYGRVV
jgi:hypothetical protein